MTTDDAAPNSSKAVQESLLENASNQATKPPLFIHEQEFREAQRIVALIASGRNPFSNEPFEKLRPEHRDSVLQAVCIISTYLSDQNALEKPHSELSENPDPSDPSTKRPLEEYLDRIERQAIVEALAETRYNRTSAARKLGITFRALRYRMERLGIGGADAPEQDAVENNSEGDDQ